MYHQSLLPHLLLILTLNSAVASDHGLSRFNIQFLSSNSVHYNSASNCAVDFIKNYVNNNQGNIFLIKTNIQTEIGISFLKKFHDRYLIPVLHNFDQLDKLYLQKSYVSRDIVILLTVQEINQNKENIRKLLAKSVFNDFIHFIILQNNAEDLNAMSRFQTILLEYSQKELVQNINLLMEMPDPQNQTKFYHYKPLNHFLIFDLVGEYTPNETHCDSVVHNTITSLTMDSIKIAATPLQPYVYFDLRRGFYKGIEICLVNTIAEKLGVRNEFMHADNSNATTIADLFIGGFTRNTDTAKTWSFSISYHQDDLTWCIQRVPPISVWQNIWYIAKPYMWVLIISIGCINAVLLYLLMPYDKEYFKRTKRDLPYILLYISLPATIGLSTNYHPRHQLIRVFHFFFLIFGFVGVNLSTAYLIKYLTNPIPGTQKQTIAEISNYQWVGTNESLLNLNSQPSVKYFQEHF